MINITCPKCGAALRVGGATGTVITCPSCLAVVANPAVLPAGSSPRRVIPLDYQVRQDIGWSLRALTVMCLLALTGALLAIAVFGLKGLDGTMVFYLVLAALAFYVLIAIFQPQSPQRPDIDSSALTSKLLQPRLAASQSSIRFFGGLMLGIAISITAWIVGWKSVSFAAVVAIPVIKFVVSVGLLFYPKWRAFAGGILLSIGIGALIFLGAVVRDALATPCKV